MRVTKWVFGSIALLGCVVFAAAQQTQSNAVPLTAGSVDHAVIVAASQSATNVNSSSDHTQEHANAAVKTNDVTHASEVAPSIELLSQQLESQSDVSTTSAPAVTNEVDNDEIGVIDAPTEAVSVSTSPQSNAHVGVQRLAFVDLRRIMAAAPQLNVIRAHLRDEFSSQETLLKQQRGAIDLLEIQLTNTPRGDQYASLEEQIISKRRAFAQVESTFRDAYSVRRNEELAKLQQFVVDQIIILAQEQSYDAVMTNSSVIYMNKRFDLTDDVLARLNQLDLMP